MREIGKFVREHVWDTCPVCGNDYAVKSNGWLHAHGPLTKRCPGSLHDGTRVAGIRSGARESVGRENQRTEGEK